MITLALLGGAVPTRLAAVVVSRDEKLHLERLISQLKQVFDEVILVLDDIPGPSVDDGWLQERGVEIVRHPPTEDLGELWRAGFCLASSDFLFWMEADEILVTEARDLASAGAQIRGVLSNTRCDGFDARMWTENKGDYWFRTNWFRRSAGVQVTQGAHCQFSTRGKVEPFPPGLLDRVQAPLLPPPLRKKWRQFDRHLDYVRKVDARHLPSLYFLARCFSGPAPAEIALWLDFVEPALKEGRGDFVQVWAAVERLIQLSRVEVIPDLPSLAAQLVQFYPDEILSHLAEAHLECTREPGAPTGRRLRELVRRRAQFKHSRGPETVGWYDVGLVTTAARDLSQLVGTLRLGELAILAREVWEELLTLGVKPELQGEARAELARLDRWQVGGALK